MKEKRKQGQDQDYLQNPTFASKNIMDELSNRPTSGDTLV